MKRLMLLSAALLCLGAGQQRCATFELSGADHDIIPLSVGARVKIGESTEVKIVPPGFDGWSITKCRNTNAVRYTLEPRKSGIIYAAITRAAYRSDAWRDWERTGMTLVIGSPKSEGKWTADYPLFVRSVTMGKRVQTPALPYGYPIIFVPPAK